MISENIEEIMRSYHSNGTIGISTPTLNEKAQKKAIALSLDKKLKDNETI